MFKWLKSRRARVTFALFLAILTLNYHPWLIPLLSFGLVFVTYPKTLRPLKNWKFWITIVLLVVLIPIFGREPDARFWIIPYNEPLFHQTSLMAIRGILVFLLFQVLTWELHQSQLSAFFRRLGIPQFDRIYGVSKETVPKAKSILQARYGEFKTNRRRAGILGQIIDLFTHILADFVRLADDLSQSPTQMAGSTDPAVLIEQVRAVPSLIIITGEQGSGKTTWLTQLITVLLDNSIPVDGLLSLRQNRGENLWRQMNQRIATGEQHALNTTEALPEANTVGKFSFYPDAFEWAGKQLSQAATGQEWFILDEIGPLEMQGKGYTPALAEIFASGTGPNQVLFTVRPSLVGKMDSFLTDYLPDLKDRPRVIIRVDV
ncbi:MAG: hypothetical protein K9N11_08830 [Lentisphaeria bacterium]|nr:hypothetical protein [Candidatus Neomarinimicrobiota bacterium]MCF7842941.1 hypothetical protein [Lentisphaeria bacterium]